MSRAEALHALERHRRDVEARMVERLGAYSNGSNEREQVRQEFDDLLTALALAMDALRKGKS